MTWVVVAVAGTTAAVAGYSSYQSGKAQEAMADYNAEIAQNEAIAQEQAIEAEARRMSKGHREAKARGRVSVSGRGGLAEGTDLLAMAEQSRNMQLDQLELQRQQDVAKTHGASQVGMYKYQGKQARSPYKWISAGLGGGAQGYSMGQSMKSAGGGGGSPQSAPTTAGVDYTPSANRYRYTA
jgi:hypothetical protein